MISSQEYYNLLGKLDQVLIENRDIKSLLQQMYNDVRDIKFQDVYAEVLDSEEAAKYLKVTPRYLQNLRNEGKIVFSQIGKVVRFKRVDLDAWIDDHKVPLKR